MVYKLLNICYNTVMNQKANRPPHYITLHYIKIFI